MTSLEAQRARTEATIKLDDGDLPGAKAMLDEVIKRLPPSNPQIRFELALSLIDRAAVARFANDLEGALGDLDSAASLATQLPIFPRRMLLPGIHLLRAKIHSTKFSKTFDLNRAQCDLDQLRALSPGDWTVEELESHIAFQKAEWDRAASKALNAAEMLDHQQWPRGAAACRRRAGEAFLELGRLGEAREQLSAALKFFAQHGPLDILSETQLALARLESRCLNHDAAWQLAENALDEVESRVRRFVDVAEQQGFLLDKLRFYDHAFDIGLAKGTSEGHWRAWTVAERSKSFYLAQLLANADVPLFDGIDPELIKELERMEVELDCCERQLGTLPESNLAEGQKLQSRLHKLSQERSAMLRSIMKANPRWAKLRNPHSFQAVDLARDLSTDVCPVSFFWRTSASEATLHVFARGASGLPLHVNVAWTKEQLNDLGRHADRLHGKVDDYAPIFPEEMTDRVFPPELRKELPADKCLLLSPHGRLRGLPLHALPLDDSILIVRWPIRYVPSLGLPPLLEAKEPGSSVLLMGSSHNAFGDLPLPDVESEINELQQLWKIASPMVIAKMIAPDATPQEAGCPPQQWSRFGVLHFACHGCFFEDRPLDGAMRLGREAIRGSELFAMNLNARVVALSACALGQRAKRYGSTEVVSEEWIGLYLPLFYAGARALVVSLWDANSQVARLFMVAFHRALAQGDTAHAAFRSAILAVHFKLPARWANWCLVGLP